MKTGPAVLVATALIILSFPLSTPAQHQEPTAATQGTFEAKVETYLQQSGYEFHKVKANSWYLLVPGKEMGEIRIILGAGPSSIAMGAVVVPKRKLSITGESMQKMMKLSYDLNYVRLCIDSDDDLLVMSQLKEQWLSAAEFKNTINLVASAADRAYGVMRPHILS
ncbi:MAG TPA: hypothetical protein VFZ22_17970 [Pyrinomonadaceae bacterium]|nr:hypothetical protein [Pyrinomonadaceae bacterium]